MLIYHAVLNYDIHEIQCLCPDSDSLVKAQVYTETLSVELSKALTIYSGLVVLIGLFSRHPAIRCFHLNQAQK